MKRSRHAKYNAKKRALKTSMQIQDANSSPSQTIAFDLIQQQTQDDVSSSSVSSSSPVEVKTNIVFNPLQHRTQGGSKDLSTSDKVRYIKNEWSSVPLCDSCRISSNVTSTISIIKDVSAMDLLIECLIRESRLSKNNLNEIPEIPLEFYNLAKSITEPTNDQLINDNEDMWIEFGQWLKLKEPFSKRDVCQHLKSQWKRLSHAAEIRNSKIEEISEIEEKKTIIEKNKMIVSAQDNNIKNFRYVTNSECIVDSCDKTLVHLDELDDFNAVIEATKAINSYYFHMLDNPIHRSRSFWKNLAERFGAFISYGDLPYTSSDTASSHNIDHQDCVNDLLFALQPISNSVNRFVNKYYEHYYTKLSKLTMGPFVPRTFGIFPTIAINFNVISNYHWDSNDDPNGLCFLVALGDFEGGELCFPQLQILVKLKPGQIVAFPSYLLLHGNLPIIRGIRFSIVYFVHANFLSKKFEDFHKNNDNDTIIKIQDLYNSQGHNPKRISLKKAQQFQIEEESSENLTDKRRYKDDLIRGRRGLRHEDLLE
ncbi:hypothetical protein RhiirA4_412764 [Rhizophagus irregularis]|uniref:Prolyl 4-hydroxylase alpha subunit domain-containing protein n=1 Tax=Rhizophagus irregularis TaxID=588596 RepID=A0A2I1HNY5_9GLOM|nr:hypothetical protein RhiirA4_412764 [Rhizophagus irregularis]